MNLAGGRALPPRIIPLDLRTRTARALAAAPSSRVPMDHRTLLDPEILGAILGLVWPGLVSIQVYRLLVPSRRFDWGQALVQGFFFTVVNYLLLFPLVF